MENSIQLSLMDYFVDSNNFTLDEANNYIKQELKSDVKEPSIRARIYEGINKGMFERVGKGVYTVTKGNEQCLLINGDGRDLSFLADNSIDAIITDHPYLDKTSHTGGNRNFADYECFQYTEIDLKEKFRVLKNGHFLVEFLPEENANNFEYLFKIKEMAKKIGLEYYAKVPWQKGSFVANTGRKAKQHEDVMIFSKGKARALKIDVKKDKAYPAEKHFMSGTKGMLPSIFDYQPASKKDKIHQAEKPVALLEAIIKFVTEEDELILDQFGGSGNLAKASLNLKRNAIVIEKDEEQFKTMLHNIEKADEDNMEQAIIKYVRREKSITERIKTAKDKLSIINNKEKIIDTKTPRDR
ncbi:MAG: site-specific DNA-methyltransferase [Erysipelotrichaceae bacterium]